MRGAALLLAHDSCVAGVVGRGPAPAPFAIAETTIAQVQAAMKAGRLTCRGWSSSTCAASTRTTRRGRRINAIVVVNPDALDEADDLDRQFKAGGPVGPLHCVPAIVKDNFETIGLQSADGSLSLKGFVSNHDAFLVKRIKEAGAIVLAKSNMAEFAFTPYETVSSILPGYTKNPYALDRVTAGSSGGTAAAVAANFGAVGLGTDTGNSIRGPSSHQALVGIRSTMGLTSRAGVVPLNLLADIAGPMARTVEDAVAVFQVVAGSDPDDPITVAGAPCEPVRPRRTAPVHYAAALRKDGLKGARIGVLRQAYERDTTEPGDRQGLHGGGRGPQARRARDRRSRARRPRRGDAAAGRHVRRVQVRHEPLPGRAGRPRPCAQPRRRSSGRGAFIPSVQLRLQQAQDGTENGPDTPPCKAEAAYRAQVREAVLKTMDDDSWTGSCIRRGATRRASSAI